MLAWSCEGLNILEWCQAFQMVEELPKIGKFKPNGQAWPPVSLPHRSTRIHPPYPLRGASGWFPDQVWFSLMLSCINNGAPKKVTLAAGGGRLDGPNSPFSMRGRKRHVVSRRIRNQHDEGYDEEEDDDDDDDDDD